MREQEWFDSVDPLRMINACVANFYRISDRKLRLFACACCRQQWGQLTDERSRQAVEAAERYADGEIPQEDLDGPGDAANDVDESLGGFAGIYWLAAAVTLTRAIDVAENALQFSGVPPAAQAALLRDTVGNPFRPPPGDEQVGHQYVCERCSHRFDASKIFRLCCPQCRTDHVRKWRTRDTWITSDVLAMANRIYSERDFSPDALLVLADALEEAGSRPRPCIHCADGVWGETESGDPIWCDSCRSSDLLTHLRAPGQHSLGCWAIDCLLGKS